LDKTIPQPKLFDPKTGAPLSLPDSDISRAVASGKATFMKGEKIPVVTPDGETGEIPAEEAQAHFNQGYQYEPLDSQAARAEKHEFGDGTGNEIKAFAAGAARGATLGLSDAALTGSGLVNPDTLQGLRQYNPVASGAGEVAGVVAPAIATGGLSAEAEGLAGAARGAAELTPASLVSKIGSKVTGAAKAAIGEAPEASGLAKRILMGAAPHAVGSAVEGAFYGAGNAVSESSLGDPDVNAEKVMGEVGLGAILGGAFGGILGAGEGALSRFVGKGGEAAKEAEALAARDGVAQGTEETAPLLGDNGQPIPTDRAKVSQPTTFDEMAARNANAPYMGLSSDAPQAQEVVDAVNKVGNDMQFPPHRAQIEALKDPEARAQMKTLEESDTKEGKILRDYNAHMKAEGVQRLQGDIESVAPGYKPAATSEQAGANLVASVKGSVDAGRAALKPAFEAFDEVAGKTAANNHEVLGVIREALPKMDGFISVEKGKIKLAPFDPSMGITETSYGVLRKVMTSLQDREMNVSGVRSIREYVDSKISPTASMGEKVFLGKIKKSLMDYMESKIPDSAPNAVRNMFKSYAQNEERRGLAEYILGGKLEDGGKLQKEIVDKNVLKNIFSDPETVRSFRELVGSKRFNEALADFLSLEKANATTDGAFSSKKFGGVLKGKAAELRAAFEDKPQALEMISARNTILRLVPDAMSGNPSGSAKTMWSLMQGIGRIGELIKSPTAVIGGGLKHIAEAHDAAQLVDKASGYLSGTPPPQSMAARIREYTGLKNLEENAAAMSRAITSHVKAFLHAGTSAAVPVSVNYLSRNRLDGSAPDRSKKEKREMYAKRLDEVTQAVSHPDTLVDRVANGVSPVSAFAPNIANSLSVKATQAAQYLYDKAPKDPVGSSGIFPHLRKYQPSDADISKWERYVTAVDHPLSVLKDLRSGVLTREGVEAVQTVYPKLYEEMTSAMVDELSNLKDGLPYQKRLQLSTFFGNPTDASGAPSFVAYMQALHGANPENQQAQGGGLSASKAKNIQFAENQKSETEALMTRA
jgi:hypothetical protein